MSLVQSLYPTLGQVFPVEDATKKKTSKWVGYTFDIFPIGSMYGIFTYKNHKNQPNVGKYTIHGSYGFGLGKIFWYYLDGL